MQARDTLSGPNKVNKFAANDAVSLGTITR
jgi:hypothetical protein